MGEVYLQFLSSKRDGEKRDVKMMVLQKSKRAPKQEMKGIQSSFISFLNATKDLDPQIWEHSTKKHSSENSTELCVLLKPLFYCNGMRV